MKTVKILVVDDSLTMRRIIMNALKAIGYEHFLEAANGQEALRLILDEGCDFIIVDWNMPVMTGVELANWVRNNGFFRQLPILMITTKSGTEDIHEALGADIDDYIVKPFTPASLKEKMESILQAKRTKLHHNEENTGSSVNMPGPGEYQ